MALNLSRFDLDCNACNEYQQEDRGCIRESPVPGRWQIGCDTYSRCPIKLVKPETYWYIRAYNFMEKGSHPRSGGWMEQSNKYISAMNIVISEVNRTNKEAGNGK